MKAYSIIYAIKFIGFSLIASYDYSKGRHYALAWFSLSMFMLALFIVSEVDFLLNKYKTK